MWPATPWRKAEFFDSSDHRGSRDHPACEITENGTHVAEPRATFRRRPLKFCAMVRSVQVSNHPWRLYIISATALCENPGCPNSR